MNEAIYMEEETRCDPETMPEKRCYTVNDLMLILNVGKSSIYTLLKRKEFKWNRVGAQYRISKKSFDAWLDEQI